MKVEFQVAMNAEEKALKNLHKVELNVEKCDDATMLKYALKAYIVEIQSQIRSNWDQFIAGNYPKEVVIGQAMFESTRGKVTAEKAKDVLKAQLSKMSPEEKLAYLKECGLL